MSSLAQTGQAGKPIRIPKLCRHKSQARGYVTWQGSEHYFWGNWPETQKDKPPTEIQLQYQAFIGNLLTNKEPSISVPQKITVGKVCLLFLKEVERERSRHDFYCYRCAVRPLVKLFGSLEAEAFGPLRLTELRAYLVETPIVKVKNRVERVLIDGKLRKRITKVSTEHPRTRKGINKILKQIRQIWQWAIRYELIPASCLEGIKTVLALRKARAGAEKEILPVDDETVRLTLEHLPLVLAAMVRIQRLTAMRPGELCRMTMGEIDRSDKSCWWYRPAQHKNAWQGHGRAVPLGPQAQEVLGPFLRADPDKPLFSPAERVEARLAELRARRKTRVQPSQVDRSKPEPKRKPGDRYTTESYGRAIKAACLKAGVSPWSPNQLRKAAADEILNAVDLDHARALLGHNHPEITSRTYAVRDVAKASRAAGKIVGV